MKQPSAATVKRLFALSGNRCAYPRCTNSLVLDGKVTARISHIRGQRPGGPRHDASQTEDARHGFANLMLLCPIHADVVDADEEAYTVERLARMKLAHEAATHPVAEPPDSVTIQIIEAPPPAGLRERLVFANRAEQDMYLTRYELHVEAAYPAANLYVCAIAPSIQRIELHPPPAGIVSMGPSGFEPG